MGDELAAVDQVAHEVVGHAELRGHGGDGDELREGAGVVARRGPGRGIGGAVAGHNTPPIIHAWRVASRHSPAISASARR